MKLTNKLLIIGFCLAFFAFAPKAMAATCLWTQATDQQWNTATNWSGCGGVVPTNADDVVFDNASSTWTMNIETTNGAAKTFVTTGTTNPVTVTNTGSKSLVVNGNMTLKSGDSITLLAIYTYAAGTFTQSGATVASILFLNLGATATTTLGSDVSVITVAINQGVLDTGSNYSITATNYFGDNGGSGIKKAVLNSSTLNVSAVNFTGTAANITISGTNHTINISSNSATANNFAGKAWGKVNFNSNASAARAHAITFGDGASFVEFNIDQLTDRRDVSISFSGDFSIASSSTWKSGGIGNDDPTYRMLIKSSAIGTTRTLTVSEATQTITLQDVDLQDIKIVDTNTPTVSLTRIGDAGGNATTTGGGYIQNVSDPKTVYADAGTANMEWVNPLWATSSGGGDVSLNNFPLPQDTAVIDNLTWDDTGNSLSNTTLYPRFSGVDASGLTESNTLNLTNRTHYGSVDFSGSGVGIGSGGSWMGFDARVQYEAGQPLTLKPTASGGGFNLGITINSSNGTVKLLGNLIATYPTGWTLTRGILDLNGYSLSIAKFSSSNTNTRELKDTAGGGKIVINALTGTGFDMSTDTGLTLSNAPDIDIGDSNNTLTASTTIAFGSTAKTFGDFKITKHAGDFDVILTGTGHTFGVFTLETPDATYNFSDVAFTAGETYTVSSFVADGTVDYKINISSVTAAAHTLSDSGGTNTVTYCNIYNSNAGGGAVWRSSYETNTNMGGNTGWIFSFIMPKNVAPVILKENIIFKKNVIFK